MTIQLLPIKLQFGHLLLFGQTAWWYNILINAFGAFIGIVGAFLLYYFQIKKKRKDKLKYVSSLLKSIIRNAKMQSNNCRELSDKINNAPIELHLLGIPASHDLKRLADKLDQEAFYHAFLSKYKRTSNSYRTFNELYSYIDFIDQQIDELKSSTEKSINSITERKKQYGEYFQLGLQKAALMLANPNLKEEQDLLNFVDNTIQSFYKDRIDVGDITYAQNKFVLPIKNKFAERYFRIPECSEIIVLLKNATNHYSGVEFQSKAYAKDLLEFHTSIMDKTNELEHLTEKLIDDFKNGM